MISIIVPVYNEQENIGLFISRVYPILKSTSFNFEIIFALDPSTDLSEKVILDLRESHSQIKLLKFSRRIGQPLATLAGIQYAEGDAVIVMDVDLQDPPELIPDMITLWKAGWDVITATRRSRQGETLFKKAFAYLGYLVLHQISDVSIPTHTGDFRLMSRRVVNEINRLKECHGFLRGMVALVGFKQTSILFDRPARALGKSKYNRFWGSIRIGMNGLISFSNRLLSVSTALGFFCLILALGLLVHSGFKTNLPLWITFFAGIQLWSIGILGEYIGRIYDEVKQRPKFIVDAAIGFRAETFAFKRDRM